MAHINFLEPPRFSFRMFSFRQLSFKSLELNYIWMAVVLCAILIFMITFGLVQRQRILKMNADLITAKAEAKKASGVPVPKVGAPKATLMDSLMQRVAWSPILNAIANNTPDTISLNFIKGASGGVRSVQIEGAGADVLAAVRYEDDLTALPIFSKVFLKSSSSKEAAPSAAAAAPGAVAPPVKADAKAGAAVSVNPAKANGGGSRSTFEIQAWLK